MANFSVNEFNSSKVRAWPRVSLIIPTLNEAANLPYVLPRIPSWVQEVLVIDARSTDDTADVARELRSDVRVVYQDGIGKGKALKLGFENSSGDIVIVLDADGSTRPEEIPNFMEQLLSGYDFVKGSRFLPGGGTVDMPLHRFLGNKLFTILTNLLHGTKYTDLCYGYFAFWRKSFKHIKIVSHGFEVEAEINIKIRKAGLRITEVPSFEEKRTTGVSKLRSIRDGWRILRVILRG